MTVSPTTPEEIEERATIDRSTRLPVMFFFTSAAAWLLVATLLGFLSSLKLRVPDLAEGVSILTYGRLFPAHLSALVYGWAMQAGIGVMLWLMARLTRQELQGGRAAIVLGHVWNAILTLALVAVVFGHGRGIPMLDFPKWMWPLFALTYSLVVVWMIPMFLNRKKETVYISEKFIVGAIIWFPWIFVTANVLINKGTAPAMGAGVNAWYITNLIYFWMAPISLAVAYYIVPKIVARPIYSYPLAHATFWLLAILAGWTGFSRFMGGPFPAWMPAVSGAATIFIILAILATVANLAFTLKGCSKLWEYSPALRFTVFGMLMLLVYAILAAVSSNFATGKNLQFSHFVVGLDTLAFYGFFSMTIFGAIYFIVPRVTRAEWPSAVIIRRHFWLSTYGIFFLTAIMLVGGIAQGENLAVWNRDFPVSVTISSAYVVGRIIAWLLITVSNLMFLHQLTLMYLGKGRKTDGPTLMHTKPGEADSARAAAGMS